ncbi:tripartite motif-containing protein 29-like [Pseudophryne corroboree]|uniref:tripartite motif-containing protein 29-like n=1 Tax=Pseudophryne corroboree TaxID=495146 RepID=UPI003081A434
MPAMEFPGLKQKLDCSLFTQPNQDKTQILCIYCLDSPVPAAKSCLLCEAHLCDRHLAVHSNSADHVLLDPTTSLGKRKCSVHGRILEYYCTKDTACICVSCRLDGEHIGHRVETLDEASEKKKEKMGDILQKLNIKKEETEKNVHSLQKLENKTKESTACVKGRVTGLVKDIKKQLKVLEKSALREISRQEKFSLLLVSSEICQLEIMKDELSGKIRHIEELCNMSDPVTVLQTSIKVMVPLATESWRTQANQRGRSGERHHARYVQPEALRDAAPGPRRTPAWRGGSLTHTPFKRIVNWRTDHNKFDNPQRVSSLTETSSGVHLIQVISLKQSMDSFALGY